MGRGDNRKTQKTRQRRAWRRKKLRLRAKIEGGNKSPASKVARPAGTTVVKKKAAK
jgi:hypothetical protein